eukprot:UN08142
MVVTKLVLQNPSSFVTSRKFTSFFSGLLNLIQYFRIFGQQNNVDLDFYVRTKSQSFPTVDSSRTDGFRFDLSTDSRVGLARKIFQHNCT